jgi:serine phosphatase RsbU (regulator of sigma subunit)
MITPAEILNARILLVDDMPANVQLLEGTLRLAGYTAVHSTTDARTVCDLHREHSYGLIILDLQMPDMDGFEVMEGLRSIEQDGYLPVLVVTAQPDRRVRALQAGAKDFIGKPFDLAELRARVHNMLEVRLLHLEAKQQTQALAATIQQLEVTREVVRLKTVAERKKMEQELALAQETQESLLPRTIPQFENFRIHAFNQPTRYVGGDFYDFLHLSSGGWMGVLADVSGKGVPAALLSSMVLGALSMEFRSGTQPQEVLNRVNQLVCDKSLNSQFVTLFLFLLGADGGGQFISAGHNPAYLYRAATGKIEELMSDHFVLGMFDFACYHTCSLQLREGDVLLVYSDGLTDAQDHQEQMFGEERVIEIIHRAAPAGGGALEQELLEALQKFTDTAVQLDDITFVVVERCA